MSSAAAFYLAKSGRVFGPYTPQQFEALRASSDIENYSWYWDPAQEQWQPIDPPPGDPRARRAPPLSVVGRGKTAAPERLEVLCHDYRGLANGQIRNVTDMGCEFMVLAGESMPSFSERAPLIMSVLDPDSAHSMDVPASVNGIYREKEYWVYRIRWAKRPELVGVSA